MSTSPRTPTSATLSRLLAGMGLSLLMASGAAFAQVPITATGTTGIDASGNTQQEREACMTGRTQQDQATCLRETNNAAAEKRSGNPVPRVAEVQGGMLNAIGIPSKGSEYFIRESVPFYRGFAPPLVVSISAPTNDGFAELAAALLDAGLKVEGGH